VSFTSSLGNINLTVEEEWQLHVEALYSHKCLTSSPDAFYSECTNDNQKFACREAQCKTCVDLDYNLYPKRLFNGEYGLDRRRISTYLYSVQKSAMSGCHKCILLFDGIKHVSVLNLDSCEALAGPVLLSEVAISLRIGDTIHVSIFGMKIEFYSQGGM
jgi:hypothetical protein